MRPFWTKWIIATGIIAVILLGSGVVFLFDAQKRREAFVAWETATPLKHPVDFSQPGQYEAEFDQTCSSAHGEVVALRIPPEVLTNNTATQLLSGLAATIEIRLQSGTGIVDSATAKVLWENQALDGAIPLFNIAPFRKGLYVAKVTVNEGAPALVGHKQILEARYLLCGLEALPAEIAKYFGLGLLVVGLIITGILGLILLKRRNHSSSHLASVATGSKTQAR